MLDIILRVFNQGTNFGRSIFKDSVIPFTLKPLPSCYNEKKYDEYLQISLFSRAFQEYLKITVAISVSLARKTNCWHTLTCTFDCRNHKQLWFSERIFLKPLSSIIQTVKQLKQVIYPGIEQPSLCMFAWCLHYFFCIPLYRKSLHWYSD